VNENAVKCGRTGSEVHLCGTHIHPFNDPFSGTTRVGHYQLVAVASAGPYASLHIAPGI